MERKIFNTGYVIMPDGKKVYALENFVHCTRENKFKTLGVIQYIIALQSIGAWRVPLECNKDSEDRISFYWRYFPGKPEDYKNANEGGDIDESNKIC